MNLIIKKPPTKLRTLHCSPIRKSTSSCRCRLRPQWLVCVEKELGPRRWDQNIGPCGSQRTLSKSPPMFHHLLDAKKTSSPLKDVRMLRGCRPAWQQRCSGHSHDEIEASGLHLGQNSSLFSNNMSWTVSSKNADFHRHIRNFSERNSAFIYDK